MLNKIVLLVWNTEDMDTRAMDRYIAINVMQVTRRNATFLREQTTTKHSPHTNQSGLRVSHA